MSRAVSITTMVKQVEALHDTKDLNAWENEFVASLVERTSGGADTTLLTERQVERLEELWRKHFA